METIYFAAFCVFIAVIIFWGFRNDDFAEFNGDTRNKKFSLGGKPPKTEEKKEDDDDYPQANLL